MSGQARCPEQCSGGDVGVERSGDVVGADRDAEPLGVDPAEPFEAGVDRPGVAADWGQPDPAHQLGGVSASLT